MATTTGPPVSVVIPTRGAWARVDGRRVRLVDHALRGLLATAPGTQVVLVLDADGPDDFVAAWSGVLGDDLVVVTTPPPFNFSGKINAGVRASTRDHVLLLNDDVRPITPEWMARMLRHATRRDVGAVGAHLQYQDGTIQHAGHAYAHGAVFHMDAGTPGGPRARPLHRRDREVSGVTAACLLQRREIFDRMGGLDEALPVNFNDVDYCWRIRQEGLRIIQCNGARLHHYESRTRRPGASEWEVVEITRRLGSQMRGPDDHTPHARPATPDPPLPRWRRWVARTTGRAAGAS